MDKAASRNCNARQFGRRVICKYKEDVAWALLDEKFYSAESRTYVTKIVQFYKNVSMRLDAVDRRAMRLIV